MSRRPFGVNIEMLTVWRVNPVVRTKVVESNVVQSERLNIRRESCGGMYVTHGSIPASLSSS